MTEATEAQLDEMIWLVDQLKDRSAIDWAWFVCWANGDPDSFRIRTDIDGNGLLVPATPQAVINWLIRYKQNNYP